MKTEIKLEEPIADSCRTLAHFIGNVHVDEPEVRATLYDDFQWRLDRLGESEADYMRVLGDAWYDLLQPEVRADLNPDAFKPEKWVTHLGPTRERKNFGIVTIIAAELDAVLDCFGKEAKAQRDDPSRHHGKQRFWHVSVDHAKGGAASGVVTFVGKARNVPCAMAVSTLLARYDVDVVILVGVAAGPKQHVKLGDVVIAERVYDYEHLRMELRQLFGVRTSFRISKPRPEFMDPELIVGARLIRVAEVHDVLRAVSSRNKHQYDLWLTENVESCEVHFGTIAAGEKLFVDGSLKRMYTVVDQRIRAADQEDSGFAQAAEHLDVPWMVVRGICDYGDPNKQGKWHYSAALSAACAAKVLISSSLLQRGQID